MESWKKFYESITKETQKAREHKQQVVVLGDFNVKVGTTIQVNKETNKNKEVAVKNDTERNYEFIQCW